MKQVIITLLLLLALLPQVPQAFAQESLLPEPPGVACENANEPLDPNSSEAWRLQNSNDTVDRACAELRIALFEQIENGTAVSEEERLNPSVIALQQRVIQLLQQLLQLLLQQR